MEENIFGLRANVEPRADIEARIAAGEGAYYIVMRCANMPKSAYPPHLRERISVIGCVGCEEPCWSDPATYLRGTITLCLQCLQQMPGKEEQSPRATREAVDEVRRAQEGR